MLEVNENIFPEASFVYFEPLKSNFEQVEIIN